MSEDPPSPPGKKSRAKKIPRLFDPATPLTDQRQRSWLDKANQTWRKKRDEKIADGSMGRRGRRPKKREGVVKPPGRERQVHYQNPLLVVPPAFLAGEQRFEAKYEVGTPNPLYPHNTKPDFDLTTPFQEIHVHGMLPSTERQHQEYLMSIAHDLPDMPLTVSYRDLCSDTPLRKRYLAAIEKLGTRSRALQLCGLTLKEFYKAEVEDPELTVLEDFHMQLYCATLQEEAYRRAVEGTEIKKYDRDGALIETSMQFSDNLMALLLRAYDPRFGTTRVKHEGHVNHAHAPSITAEELKALPPEDQVALRNILGKLAEAKKNPSLPAPKDANPREE